MGTTDRERALREDFEPLLIELGFRLVELHAVVVDGRLHLELVIYSPDGVSIDDCANVHRTLMPRAELMLDDRDIAMQVASPGIDRVLKDTAEFGVFQGCTASILVRGEDWVRGKIGSTTDDSVNLDMNGEIRLIPFADIQKAKLEN